MFHALKRPHMVLSLFILLCTFSPEGARASLAQCQKTKKAAVDACNTAMTNAVKNSSQSAGAVSAACSAKDEKGNMKRGISNCANDMKNQGALSNDLLDKAIGSCDAQQKSCDDACNPSNARKEEKAAVSQLKQACTKAISASKAQGAAGKEGGNQAQDGADQTKNASQNDSMPQMPQSQGGGEGGGDSPSLGMPQSTGSPTDTAATAAAQTPANAPPAAAFAKSCNYDSAGYDSRCTETLASKCNEDGERNSEMCKTFRSAYCTRGGSVPSGFGENALKLGSGIGSDFCQKSLDAYKNETQAQLKTAGASGATAGGVAAGGGSSGAAGGAGGNASLAPDVKAPSEEDGLREAAGKGGGDADGGGGGYSYGGNGSGGGEYSPESLTLDHARRSIAAAEQADQTPLPGYQDVQGLYGPNVFSILAGVYRNHCQKGRALHCGPEKK